MNVIHTVTTIAKSMPLALVRGALARILQWQRWNSACRKSRPWRRVCNLPFLCAHGNYWQVIRVLTLDHCRRGTQRTIAHAVDIPPTPRASPLAPHVCLGGVRTLKGPAHC